MRPILKKRAMATTLALWAVGVSLESAGAEVVYWNDFENVADPLVEWSDASVSVTPNGHRFLGEFTTGTTILSLGDVQSGTITVTFDLYAIRSWDGNREDVFGPDIWYFTAGGIQVEHTTFSNAPGDPSHPSYYQAYPDLYPGGKHVAQTGTCQVNTLGYSLDNNGDSVYCMEYTFQHEGGTLELELSGLVANPAGEIDEAWGIDNIQVSTSCDNCLIIESPEMELWGDVGEYDAVIVINGGSILVPPRVWSGDAWEGGWLRLVTDTLYLGASSGIYADVAGHAFNELVTDDGPGPGGDSDSFILLAGGGGYGGEGGHVAPSGAWGGETYGSCTEIDYQDGGVPEMGSRGGNAYVYVPNPLDPLKPIEIFGSGGSGGGAYEIIAQDVTIEGTLSANGGIGLSGASLEITLGGETVTLDDFLEQFPEYEDELDTGYGSGGGSGGQIVIDASTVYVGPEGKIQADGGGTSSVGREAVLAIIWVGTSKTRQDKSAVERVDHAVTVCISVTRPGRFYDSLV